MKENKRSDELHEPDTEFCFESSYSGNLPAILKGLNFSLVATSYQSDKLFFIRSDGESIDVNFKTFSRPMGLAISEHQLTLGTFNEVIRFNRNDKVIDRLGDKDKVDACFTPNVRHTTGMINIHDIAYGKSGLWVTNSAFSCLATIEPEHSFVPQWKPPFISELLPEDRCHLNGMALLDGCPRYVTTFNQSDQARAWRGETRHDGTLIDVVDNRILLTGLSLPHSPRCYRDKVYFCESGYGRVHCYDPVTETSELVIELPGFTRGMDFFGPLMFVGLSKARRSEVKTQLPLVEKVDETFCGIWVINLEDTEVVGFLRFDGDVSQIYDVGILGNSTYPELLEPSDERTAHIFSFPPLL